MGAAVKFIGAVGDDAFGAGALADLAGEDVDVSSVQTLADCATGVALIVVDERGENQIAVASGANARVDRRLVEARVTSYEPAAGGAFLANFEVSDEAILSGARFAAMHGMTLLVNPAPARELPDGLVQLHPILLPNEHEAHALTGEHDPRDAAPKLEQLTSAPVIVTLGAGGALLAEDGGVEHLPAPVVNVVDTTGAGDAFAGAFAAELAAGSALREAARVAVHAASRSVTAPGARVGMPFRANLG